MGSKTMGLKVGLVYMIYRCIVLVLPMLICSLFLCGCSATSGTWYKPGHYQADFDRDCVECELLAEDMARQQSVTGRSRNLEVYIKAYNSCLFSKGWSDRPLDTVHTKQTVSPQVRQAMCTLQNDMLRGFGYEITLPSGFSVLYQKPSVYGPTQTLSTLSEGPEQSFLNVIFQQSDSLAFEVTDYPVKSPYFLFDSSHPDVEPQWSAFCGPSDSEWIAGVGTYVNISDSKRIILIATTALPGPVEPVPQGLRLDKGQYNAMRAFTEKTTAWLHNRVVKVIR